MARVMLFFDGKNHMKDLRLAADERWIDHGALARWVVEQVGGTELIAAHYYTGVPSPADDAGSRTALSDLLADLDRRPGFFVHRFQRVSAQAVCSQCGHTDGYTKEKMVDTQLVADLIVHGVRNTYDIAVVFSGDLDVAPGLDAVHALGKRVWIATFGHVGVSRALHRAAWAMLELRDHLDAFAYAMPQVSSSVVVGDPTSSDADVLRELHRAQQHFTAGGGFVGTQYFLHRWRGVGIPEDPDLRRLALERLIQAGLVEMYDVQGRSALRVVGRVALRASDGSQDDTVLIVGE